MSKKKRFGVSQALTRGLSETIHVVENNAGVFRNVVLPLSRVELDPDNPRKLSITLMDVQEGIHRNDPFYEKKLEELEKLKELAFTIDSSGIINPIVVYKRGEVYRIVAGERRCLASFLAGKTDIEARVFNEKPKAFELKLIQWIENTAREDLNLDERISNIEEILSEYQNQHDVAEVSATLLKNITGLSLPQASYYLSVINAPEDVKHAIKNGKLQSLDKAAIISNLDSEELRYEALTACFNGCSLKLLRKIITNKKLEHRQARMPESRKRGRAIQRVRMGFTLNPIVVQAIVHSVIAQAEFKKYSSLFSKIDWKHLEQATHAFKKLIEILEHEVVR